MEFSHKSVLLEETIDALRVRPEGIYVDGTLGGGGHSYEICKRLSKNGRLIGIDQDEDAIKAAGARLLEYQDRTTLIRSNYEQLPILLRQHGIKKIDGIVLDLGVSSFQLDEPMRGFSYRAGDAPLDMRMDQSASLSAKDIVNQYDEKSLYLMIKNYGEEKDAYKIAKNIVQFRKKKEICTTGELVDIIIRSKGSNYGGKHPATKTFQAIRIECNAELEVLEKSLDAMVDVLKPGGRICVITFHSLEDRIVKNAFKRMESPCTCPPEFPVCVCNKKSKGKVITKKPILPSEQEKAENNRSKSAKLRVFEVGKVNLSYLPL